MATKKKPRRKRPSDVMTDAEFRKAFAAVLRRESSALQALADYDAGKAPKTIKTKAAYEAALAEMESIMDDPPDEGTVEAAHADVLGALLEAYEDEHFPIPVTWRHKIAAVRAVMRAAERQRGRKREETLIRACRAFAAIDTGVDEWPPKEYARFVKTGRIGAFDRAARAVELKLSRMVKGCVGCVAMRPLPEDRAMAELHRRRVSRDTITGAELDRRLSRRRGRKKKR